MTERRCVGFGQFDTCGALLGPEDLALNGAGLWCVRCELLRRETITGQMAAIQESFERMGGVGAELDADES